MYIKSYTLDKRKDNRPRIPISINGRPTMSIIDTGANIPVWTTSMDNFVKLLKIDSDTLKNMYIGKYLIGGFGGRNLCHTFKVSLTIGPWSFGNVPISINDINTELLFNMLIPADMLISFDYTVKNSTNEFLLEQIENHPRCKLKLYKKVASDKIASETFQCFLEEQIEEESDKLGSRMMDFW